MVISDQSNAPGVKERRRPAAIEEEPQSGNQRPDKSNAPCGVKEKEEGSCNRRRPSKR